MTNPEEIKEEFYNNLRNVRWKVPCTDKLIIAGDFNVRIGKVDKWPRVIGFVVMIHCCLLHQEKNKHSKTAAKPPWKIAVMKLRDKDNQQKLKKECTRLWQDWKDKIRISVFGRTRS